MSTSHPLGNASRSTAPAAGNMTTAREDLVAAGLSLVIVLALYLDGRAHWLALPDSFFTPWHGLLYGGLAALGGWLLLLGARRRTSPHVVRSAFTAPRGYGYALLGLGVFAGGGVADMIWHLVFGIEEGIDALLSPSHLMLFVGASLLFSGPVITTRSRRPAPAREDLRAVAATLATLAISAVVAFSLSYLSAFTAIAPTQSVGHFPEGSARHIATELRATGGLASYLMTSLVLVAALVFLARTTGLIRGTVTLFVTVHAALSLMLVNYTVLGTGLVLTAAAAGLSIDFVLILARGLRATQSVQLALVAALTPMGVVLAQIMALGAADGVEWSSELLGGVLVLSSLVSLAAVAAFTTGAPRETGSA